MIVDIRKKWTKVFGTSSDKQQGNKGYFTPMIAGTEHGNNLAACTPYTPDVLAMIGMRFLTQAHTILTLKRSQEDIENG
jgi:hypothetical protein